MKEDESKEEFEVKNLRLTNEGESNCISYDQYEKGYQEKKEKLEKAGKPVSWNFGNEGEVKEYFKYPSENDAVMKRFLELCALCESNTNTTIGKSDQLIIRRKNTY